MLIIVTSSVPLLLSYENLFQEIGPTFMLIARSESTSFLPDALCDCSGLQFMIHSCPMRNYEEIYKGPKLYWGSEPSDLVKRFSELAPPGSALDLGMGEGRDALHLAGLGFHVTGVEAAQTGVDKCLALASKKNLRINAIASDVRSFKIPRSRYSLITAINLFQFMTKTDALGVIHRAITGLKRGGILICECFTIDDPYFKAHKKKSQEIAPGVFRESSGHIYSLYAYGELLQMCCEGIGSGPITKGLRPMYYSEYDFYDTTHGPAHWHGVADFVGKKL